jgi:hypothetical protein
MTTTIKIDDLDSGERVSCSLAEFLDANGDDEDLCALVGRLADGTSFLWGGGGSPVVRIARVSAPLDEEALAARFERESVFPHAAA